MRAPRLVALTMMTGCMPYVLPPATGAMGAQRTLEAGERARVHAELGVSPFQLSPRLLNRAFDATVSATFDRATHNAWGAAVAAGPVLHPWPAWSKRDVTTRLAPQLVGRWNTDGRAAALRISVERAAFYAEGNQAVDASGAIYGEGAIGLYVEAGMQWPEMDERGWSLGVGVTLRMPAAAGIACCVKP